MRKTLTFLALLSAAGAVFNLITIPIFHEDVFLYRDISSPVEILMLIAYVLIFAFNVVSLIWLILKIHDDRRTSSGYVLLLMFAIICIIGLMGQKVMLDEVAHEYHLGWNVQGEFFILMGLLGLQAIYSTLMALTLYRKFTR